MNFLPTEEQRLAVEGFNRNRIAGSTCAGDNTRCIRFVRSPTVCVRSHDSAGSSFGTHSGALSPLNPAGYNPAR